MLEYAVLAALISAGAMLTIIVLSEKITSSFAKVDVSWSGAGASRCTINTGASQTAFNKNPNC